MKCSFTPYEGNDPYIFISYSHRDTDRVFPVLEQLNNRGFRVWYDEGIEWGSEWPEAIGAHLHNSTVCMLFHSKSSVESLNCRQEIYYALKERKSVLSIYLEDVTLTYGLDMQLSSFQSTFLYQYDDLNKFYENLFKIKTLQACQKKNVDNKKMVLSDGSTYSGDLSDGKKHGKGKLIFANGNIYEGDFVDDKRTGKGKFTWADGNVYEGDFIDDKQTGKGKFTWANGDVYEGDFIDDKRTGKGKFIWADGTVYEGDFVDGKQTGKGKKTLPDGKVYEGDFVDGMLQGSAVKSALWRRRSKT